MKPPRCMICQRTLDDLPFSSFKLVRFAINAEEKALERQRAEEGWAGHPPWDVWFCDEHAAPAEELSHLHWRDAKARLETSQGGR